MVLRPYDPDLCRAIRLCASTVAFAYDTLCQLLIISGDVEQNPGPTKEILAALSKLEQNQSSIRTELNELKNTQLEHSKMLTEISGRLAALEITHPKSNLDPVVSEANQIKLDIEVLKAANNDTNNRMRRNNLLFFYLDDAEKETWNEPETKLINICPETLKLQLDTNDIERAHRFEKYGNEKKRPVIVKPTHFKTKENILACGRQRKGTDYAIRKYFAPPTRQARSKLI